MARILRSFALTLCILGAGSPAPAAADGGSSLIVKLRSEGAHAVRACAETRQRQQRSLADATADRSGSLDAVMHRTGATRIRALFRRPDGRSIASQERALRRRFASVRKRRSQRAPAISRRSDAGTLAHIYRVDLPRDSSLGEALAAFAADPHVEYAQPNYGVDPDRFLDDPFLHSSGSWGQRFGDLWGIDRIGLPAAWDRTLGEGTIIAIVDTGVDTRHPDIVDNLWVHPGEDLDGNGIADPEEWNGIDDDGNGFVDDLQGFDFHDSIDANEDGDFDDPGDLGDPDPFDKNGHGTHVAGTAAARGDNGIGIAGVAPRARVMPLKIFPDGGGSADTAKAWRAVLYAAENGADVINASWSCSPRCPSNPVGEEVVRLVHDLGVVFVTSAGNRADDTTFTSPERLPETLAVGAGVPDGGLAPFSSFGWVVDVVAPGEAILSLKIEDATRWSPRRFVGDDYMFLEGTSMSSPHVAGVVALMLSADPTLSADEVRARLRRTAEDAGAAGPDHKFGHGWVRPDRALIDVARPDARARFDPTLIGGRVQPKGELLPIDYAVEGTDVVRAVLAFGQGVDPETWQELAAHGSGEFSHPWDVSELPNGPYLLRLTVVTPDGEAFTEYAPLSLDRAPPFFMSPLGPPAVQPDIAGKRVVWTAKRTTEDGSPAPDVDLRLGVFGALGGEFVDDDPGNQSGARLSSRAMVWSDRPADAAPNDRNGLAGCARRGPGCAPFAIATDPARIRSAPSLVGRTVVYGEPTPGGFELLLCRLSGNGCVPRVIAPLLSRPPELQFDGRRVLVTERAGAEIRLFLCDVSRIRPCVLRETEISHPFHLTPKAYEGGIAVFEDIDILTVPNFEYRLFVCALDPQSGACTPMQIATQTEPFDVDFSQGRIVWSALAEDGTMDVALCRFGAGRGECPIQAITLDSADQHGPRIDGHRLVWVDDRDGPNRIASLTLPTLAPLSPRRVRAGHVLRFELRETSGSEDVHVEGTTEAGEPLESLGVRLLETKWGRHRVVWRPGESDVGTHRFRFEARLPNGLYDERVVRIEVLSHRVERGRR